MRAISIIALILLIAMIASTAVFVFAIDLPTQREFNNKITDHEIMCYDMSSLQGMKGELLYLWNTMNTTFEHDNFANTYGAYFFWEQTYSQSLDAQNKYFVSIVQSIDAKQQQLDNMASNGTSAIDINDKYQQYINQTRKEMKREGGLIWAFGTAYYLRYYSYLIMYQWFGLMLWIITIVFVVIAGLTSTYNY